MDNERTNDNEFLNDVELFELEEAVTTFVTAAKEIGMTKSAAKAVFDQLFDEGW